MIPTVSDRFFASAWPRVIFCTSTMVCIVAFALEKANWRCLADCELIALVILGAPIGYLLGIIPSVLILLPILQFRALLNGAPFMVGDSVQIIGGTYDGSRGKIYSLWKGNRVRVELGQEAKEQLKDIFSPIQMLRIYDSEPGSIEEGSSEQASAVRQTTIMP